MNSDVPIVAFCSNSMLKLHVKKISLCHTFLSCDGQRQDDLENRRKHFASRKQTTILACTLYVKQQLRTRAYFSEKDIPYFLY